MKKDAQIEEYKFMESIMNRFEWVDFERKCKSQIEEIKRNGPTKEYNKETLVKMVAKKQSEMVNYYLAKQQELFRQMDQQIQDLQGRNSLIDHWKKFKGKEFFEKYKKRYQQLHLYKEFLEKQRKIYLEEHEEQRKELQRRQDAPEAQIPNAQVWKQENEKIAKYAANRKDKCKNMENLLAIISEDMNTIMKDAFNDEDKAIRERYCENLYDMEKCLKKIRDLETSASHALIPNRSP